LTQTDSSRARVGEHRSHRIALHVTDLNGGGVQRVMLALAAGFAERGHEVDVLVGNARGPLRAQISAKARVVELAAARPWEARRAVLRADPTGLLRLAPVLLAKRLPPGLVHVPAFARELAARRYEALVSATPQPNFQAVWARRLARVSPRLLVTEHVAPSQKGRRLLVPLVRHTYAQADAIAAVSRALGDDLAAFAGLPRERIATLYNPVVDAALREKAHAKLDHPWLAPGTPPVVLGAGRLADQKDFPTLLRAFALLRARRPARLVILGAAKVETKTIERRAALLALATQLGVADDVLLPGATDNPFAWMARAAVFALSSRFEGLGNVLIEAMACGCPVVSTDCASGPAEILDGGRYGGLVPVGDAAALAAAIEAQLDAPTDRDVLRRRADDFTVERAVGAYLALLFPA
jgi:glycosyltransferase involved in cell wall biosynthesis